MKTTRVLGTIAAGAVLALGMLAPDPAVADDAGRIDGTWLGTFTYADGYQGEGLFTFWNRSDDTGTMLFSGSDSLIPPYPCLPEQGVWHRRANGSITASDTGYCFDIRKRFAAFGTVKARYTITLAPDGRSFVGHGDLSIVSNTGEVAYENTFTVTARRQ